MRIRFAKPGDAGALLAIYRPYIEKTAYTFEIDVPTAADFAARVREIVEEGFPYLVVEEAGEALGYCYASRYAAREAYRPSVDLSLYLAPACHRRHVGTALYTCILRLLTAQGFENVYGVVTASNAPSRALHERMGFRLVGTMRKVGYKFGDWHDVCYYERFLGEHPRPMQEIRPVGALEDAFVSSVLAQSEYMIRAAKPASKGGHMEFWDLYDENRRATGRQHVRGVPMPEGMFHLVVDVLTINPRGELLLTLRHPEKHYGGQWEFTGGSVLAGETTPVAASRELREETGLCAGPEVLQLLATHRDRSNFYDEYLYRCPLERPAIALQEGETVDYKWVTRAQFEQMIGEGAVCTPVIWRYEQMKDNLPF